MPRSILFFVIRSSSDRRTLNCANGFGRNMDMVNHDHHQSIHRRLFADAAYLTRWCGIEFLERLEK